MTATATLQAAGGLLLNLSLAWMLAAVLACRWLGVDGRAPVRPEKDHSHVLFTARGLRALPTDADR